MNRISNRNLLLILTYLLISSSALIGYIFMVAYRAHGYDPQIYNKGYLYFIIFQFMIFTMLVPLWDYSQITRYDSKGKFFRGYISMLVGSSLLSLASIPLILIIFMSGQLNGVNFVLPLIIQICWGTALLSLKQYLNMKDKMRNFTSFTLILFIFIVLILTLVFLYLYTQYGSLVVTTVYDNDFPNIFFINPLLTITGLLYTQIGGTNYLGKAPIITSILFSLFITIASLTLTIKSIPSKAGGIKHGKTSSRPDAEEA